MTEPIQWGGEFREGEKYLDLGQLREAIKNRTAYPGWGADFVAHQIRLIGQFWDEVAKMMEAAELLEWKGMRCDTDFTQGHNAGRVDALRDILELSKKYPFG